MTITIPIDAAAVAAELEQLDWERDDQDSDIETRRLFLGTVFALMPSGKYYTPWACSNVAGDCTRCGGSGVVAPRVRGRRAKKVHSMLQSYVKRTIARLGTPAHARYAEKHRERRARLYTLVDTTCAHCSGFGSRSAKLDEDWRTRVESEGEAHGWSLENGDGDPCDLFAVQYRDCEDNDD